MGLIFSSDGSVKLDAEQDNNAHCFATASLIANHTKEWQDLYRKQYLQLIERELAILKGENNGG